eukprot:g21243.t1
MNRGRGYSRSWAPIGGWVGRQPTPEAEKPRPGGWGGSSRRDPLDEADVRLTGRPIAVVELDEGAENGPGPHWPSRAPINRWPANEMGRELRGGVRHPIRRVGTEKGAGTG